MEVNKPYLFPVFIIGLWLSMSAFFSLISGWLALALDFRAAEKPEGQKVISQVKQMGIVPENAATHMIVSPAGLYLYASLLFRFAHSALLIPWSKVHLSRTVRTLWWNTYVFELNSSASIRVTQRAYDAIRQYTAS